MCRFWPRAHQRVCRGRPSEQRNRRLIRLPWLSDEVNARAGAQGSSPQGSGPGRWCWGGGRDCDATARDPGPTFRGVAVHGCVRPASTLGRAAGASAYTWAWPPSTNQPAPLTKLEASETRKVVTAATSSRSPTLPSGTSWANASRSGPTAPIRPRVLGARGSARSPGRYASLSRRNPVRQPGGRPSAPAPLRTK